VRSVVVLPTYNECENLAPMLDALLALDSLSAVVVVDDSSPDGTGDIAEERARRCDRVHAVHRTERGLGSAYVCGFRHALNLQAEAIVAMDCDFSHNPADVPRLLARLPECDIAVGSRYVAGGGTRGWPLRRKLLSRSANAFARRCVRLDIRDCTSGFRAYRASLIKQILQDDMHSRGYSIQVELLARGVRQYGARVVEIPILFDERKRGVSKIGSREVVLGLKALIRLRARLAMSGPATSEPADDERKSERDPGDTTPNTAGVARG